MDDNQIIEQFDQIEKKILRLIGIRESLETEIRDLKDYIAQLEQELEEKIEVEKNLIEEKTFVRTKIDRLLNKMEDINIADDSDKQQFEGGGGVTNS